MRNQVTIFLPTYSLLTTYSAHTSERVKKANKIGPGSADLPLTRPNMC